MTHQFLRHSSKNVNKWCDIDISNVSAVLSLPNLQTLKFNFWATGYECSARCNKNKKDFRSSTQKATFVRRLAFDLK